MRCQAAVWFDSFSYFGQRVSVMNERSAFASWCDNKLFKHLISRFLSVCSSIQPMSIVRLCWSNWFPALYQWLFLFSISTWYVSKTLKLNFELIEKFYSQQWQQFDFIVASVLTSTSLGMSTLLLYCYFGKLATESYETMSDCVYKMEWYEQPNELQKCFSTIMDLGSPSWICEHSSRWTKAFFSI